MSVARERFRQVISRDTCTLACAKQGSFPRIRADEIRSGSHMFDLFSHESYERRGWVGDRGIYEEHWAD